MKKHRILALVIILIVTSCGGYNTLITEKSYLSKENSVNFPELRGYVNDYEELFSLKEKKELAMILRKHEELTTNQIIVATLTSLEPYDNIDDFSTNLANYWRVGQKGKDNGILISFGKGLRKVRIDVGYGLERRLTDAEAKKILDDIMIPEFKKEDFFKGVKNGIEAVIAQIE